MDRGRRCGGAGAGDCDSGGAGADDGGGAGALSNDGGGSWQYYKDITITNPGGALSDYQVLVDLMGANFDFRNARTDGADIRFTDAGCAEPAYWIE